MQLVENNQHYYFKAFLSKSLLGLESFVTMKKDHKANIDIFYRKQYDDSCNHCYHNDVVLQGLYISMHTGNAFTYAMASDICMDLIYSQTSMARTPLKPWKYVRAKGSSS